MELMNSIDATLASYTAYTELEKVRLEETRLNELKQLSVINEMIKEATLKGLYYINIQDFEELYGNVEKELVKAGYRVEVDNGFDKFDEFCGAPYIVIRWG